MRNALWITGCLFALLMFPYAVGSCVSFHVRTGFKYFDKEIPSIKKVDINQPPKTIQQNQKRAIKKRELTEVEKRINQLEQIIQEQPYEHAGDLKRKILEYERHPTNLDSTKSNVIRQHAVDSSHDIKWLYDDKTLYRLHKDRKTKIPSLSITRLPGTIPIFPNSIEDVILEDEDRKITIYVKDAYGKFKIVKSLNEGKTWEITETEKRQTYNYQLELYKYILQTADGGNSWVELENPTDYSRWYKFTNEKLLYSFNEGEIWETFLNVKSINHIIKVVIKSDKNIIINKGCNTTIETDDGGETWAYINHHGKHYGSRSVKYITYDRGKTWKEVRNPY